MSSFTGTLRLYLGDGELPVEVFLARHRQPVLLHDAAESGVKALFKTVAIDPVRRSADETPRWEISERALEWQVTSLRKRADGTYGGIVSSGRAANNDVVIPYADVSKMHVYFTIPRDGGGWTLTDNNSRNGTVVDGVPLIAKQPFALGDEAQILLGKYRYLFLMPTRFRELLRSVRAVIAQMKSA